MKEIIHDLKISTDVTALRISTGIGSIFSILSILLISYVANVGRDCSSLILILFPALPTLATFINAIFFSGLDLSLTRLINYQEVDLTCKYLVRKICSKILIALNIMIVFINVLMSISGAIIIFKQDITFLVLIPHIFIWLFHSSVIATIATLLDNIRKTYKKIYKGEINEET